MTLAGAAMVIDTALENPLLGVRTILDVPACPDSMLMELGAAEIPKSGVRTGGVKTANVNARVVLGLSSPGTPVMVTAYVPARWALQQIVAVPTTLGMSEGS